MVEPFSAFSAAVIGQGEIYFVPLQHEQITRLSSIKGNSSCNSKKRGVATQIDFRTVGNRFRFAFARLIELCVRLGVRF